MNTPDALGSLQRDNYNAPLTPDEIARVFEDPLFDIIWNDPATARGANEALVRAAAALAARGELMQDPYPEVS